MSEIRRQQDAGTREMSAKLLELQFGGYFMCRLATDPDPTNEELGVSGYTMALVSEDRLDQVIRLQADDEFARKNLREPAEQMGIRVGVDVRNVLFDGKPYAPGIAALRGAKVSLEGRNEPFAGPIFDSRNNIVGSDDTMAFVVNPFDLVVRGSDVTLRAVDHLNPGDPSQKIWQIEDPNTYTRRFPTLSTASSEVMSILRVFDQTSYFTDRLRYLRGRIAELEAQKVSKKDVAARDEKLAELRSRIYQIEFWGNRVFNKMAFQLTYDFRINGEQTVEDPKGLLQGTADCEHPWTTTFWFGGWDGDLLVGYMQGSLGLPFRPSR